MCDDNISADAWAEAEVVDGKDENENKIVHYHVDVLWHYIAKIIVPGTRFKLHPQVAYEVLFSSKFSTTFSSIFSTRFKIIKN